jgi:hypothetical protein
LQRTEFFALQKTILEKLFPEKWFEQAQPGHPAYRRWKLCDDILKQGGAIRYPEQKGLLSELARLVLDCAVFVTLTEGNMNELKLGSLDLYGDNAVKKFIQTRVTEAVLFEDVMVQLAFGAWHKSERHNVTPSEKEGFPDLEISIPTYGTPFLFECKRVKSGTKNRIRKVINKANAQIKVPGKKAYGIATVDISDVVGIQRVENDEVPSIVKQVASFVKSALGKEFNRSIGAVVLMWDDYLTYGTPPEKMLFAFRRRYVTITHPTPLEVIPTNAPLFNGYTVEYSIHWESRPDFGRYTVQFTEQYVRESQQQFKISPEMVVDAIRRNNRYHQILLEGGNPDYLFARLPTGDQSSYILVYASESSRDRLAVLWAFRVPTDLCPEIHLLNPLHILSKFAEKYGLLIRIGDIESKFILAHRVQVSSQDTSKVFSIVGKEGHDCGTYFLLRVNPVGDHFIADCRLMFCIDKTLYLSWLKEAKRELFEPSSASSVFAHHQAT